LPPLAGTLARSAATRTAPPAARSDFVPERSIVRSRQRVDHDLLELARRASPNARCREIEDRGFVVIETRRHRDEVRAVAHVVRTHATGAPKRVAGIRRERVPGARTVVSLTYHTLATYDGAPRGIRRGEDHRDRVARDVLVAMLVADTRRRAYVVRLRELPALFQPVGVAHARAGIAGPIAQHCDELAFRPPRRGRRRRWTWLRASGPRRVDGGGGSACYVGEHEQRDAAEHQADSELRRVREERERVATGLVTARCIVVRHRSDGQDQQPAEQDDEPPDHLDGILEGPATIPHDLRFLQASSRATSRQPCADSLSSV